MLEGPLQLQSSTIPKGNKVTMVATKAKWGLVAGDDLTEAPPKEFTFGVARSPHAFFKATIRTQHLLEKPADAPGGLECAELRGLSLNKTERTKSARARHAGWRDGQRESGKPEK